MENNQEPQPQQQPSLDNLDIQATRDLLARQGVPMISPALPDFFAEAHAAAAPIQDPAAEGEWTGKDIAAVFAGNEDAEFTFDEVGRSMFKKFADYKASQSMEFAPFLSAMGQMGGEIMEGVAAGQEHLLSPGKLAASTAEGAYRGLRDIYGILAQSEDPSSPLFKLRSFASRLIGKDDGDIDSQMRQFHDARRFVKASYKENSLLAEILPEGWKDHFSSYVDPKFALAISYIALDVPEAIFTAGGSTPATAVRMAARAGSKAARGAKAAATFASWADNTTLRMSNFGQRVMGNTMEGAGKAAQAPFKAIYGVSQSAAQLGGDYAGNAVRNMAAAEVVELGSQVLGSQMRHPAVGFMRSFGAESLGEIMQVAGQDMVDRALGKTMVKADSLGMTTLERLASGTAKGADTMSREAQMLSKGLNAAVGWAPSLSGAALKAMVRDGMFGAALGYANSPAEGTAAGAGMGVAWGGLSGSIRHLHSYTNYTPQDSRVVDNFRDYVIPSFGRIMGPTSMEMAKRFHDHVNGFGDLRTSSIELSHLSTLVAHEASLVGEGNVMFYFGNSEKEFSNVLAESNIKPEDYDKAMSAYRSMGESASAGMFEKIKLNDGSVKRLIAINSDLYRPTTARHEITHALFRSVVEANAEMDSVIDRETGRYMGDVFNPSYAGRIFGTAKDMGVMPDAAWESLMVSYGAARDWAEFGKPTDPTIVGKITEMAKANYGGLLGKIRDHLSRGVDMQKYEVMDDFRMATNMAEEAFAYYASGTSNVFPVDKYVKDPAARNLLRGYAENRAARKNSRILSSLEEAGVEIRAKFTNADGSPKLFDENGNPAIETFMFDDGLVIRTPGMDSWVESVMKQAYARSEVLVSTLDPFRQEAFAKEHGKSHLFNVLPTGGMRLKSPSELDEASKEQAAKILASIEGVSEAARPVIEHMKDGSKKIKLESASAETMAVIQQSGALTDQEFNELSAIVKVAEKNRMGDVTFNVMTGTLLAHTKQVRKGAGVFRLTGSDVPVTYRTFMPYSVEVTIKTHDADGNPLRAAKGGILIHSVDVAAVNRRLMKTFKRPDVRSLFGGNFETFVDRFNLYVQNQSGLNGAKVPSADLFKPEFGDKAEKVRDIMYESFGGRKRKDDAFINTPGDGYAGGADDPNRPFYTMRFDTLADIKVHPTSWNVHSKVQPFPYVHVQGYDGVSRNFQITGFTERDLGNGKKYLKDNNGFEIYETKSGFALFNPFAIKVGVFNTAKAAIKRATAELQKIDEADRVEQPDNMVNDTGHHDQTIADLEIVSDASSRGARLHHMTGIRDVVAGSLHMGKSVVDHIDEQTAQSNVNSKFLNAVGEPDYGFSSKFISLTNLLGDAAKSFDTEVEIDGVKYSVSMSDTQISISDPSLGVTKGTEISGTFQNELLRIDRSWFKDLYSRDKALLNDQLARRMSHAIKVSALHKAGLIPLPTSFTPESVDNYRIMGEALMAGAAGPSGLRDKFISERLAEHGAAMATLAGDIRWSFFDAGDMTKRDLSDSRGKPQSTSFEPSQFTKRLPRIEQRWASAFSSFRINDAVRNDPILGPIVAKAESSQVKSSYERKTGGALPIYIDVLEAVVDDAKRDQLTERLVALGAEKSPFWEFHSNASGIDDILPLMREYARGAVEDRVMPGREKKNVNNKRAKWAQSPMQEGVAKEMVMAYLTSLESVAKKGGMFQKSVAGFFGPDGKLRTEGGNKQGFISSLAVMDLSDPDIKQIASLEKLYSALSHISSEIKNSPDNQGHKLDYVRVLSLIMRLTTDKSLIFHEFKSMDDRSLKPGMNEMPSKPSVFQGANSDAMDFYTLPPTQAFIVNRTASGGAIAYSPINVNRNHPSRYDRMAADRTMHIGEDGMPAMISLRPKYGQQQAVDLNGISHVIATDKAVRGFMASISGTEKTTMLPDSLSRTDVGIMPSGNINWNGIIPAVALQLYATPGGATKLSSIMPSAQRAVEQTLSSAMGLRSIGLVNALKVGVDTGRNMSSADISLALKDAGVIGDNMIIMEQLAHGYAETMSKDTRVRHAGALRIAQSLAIHDSMFKAGLDADSFPGEGPAHSFMSSMGQKTSKLTPMSSRYLRMLKEFINTGSVAAVDDGHRMMLREMPGSVAEMKTDSAGNRYGVKSTDTVQSSPLMMITGQSAIAQLDAARKDEMLKLGLIGRMSDGMGNTFDYFELSDSKAEVNLSKFGGSARGLLEAAHPDANQLVERFLRSHIDAYASGDMAAIDRAAANEMVRSFNRLDVRLKDVINHPELYAFYPNLAEVSVKLLPHHAISASMSGDGAVLSLTLGLLTESQFSEMMAAEGFKKPDGMSSMFDRYMSPESIRERFRRIVLHEMQHAIVHMENLYPVTYGSMLDVGSIIDGRPSSERAASIVSGVAVNTARIFGGDEQVMVSGPTSEMVLDPSANTMIDQATFAQADQRLIERVEQMYGSSSKLISMVKHPSGQGFSIQRLTPDETRVQLRKILDAPMSVDMIRNVIPNQMHLNQVLMSELGKISMLIASNADEAKKADAYQIIHQLAGMVDELDKKLAAYSTLAPKYDAAAMISATRDISREIMSVNEQMHTFTFENMLLTEGQYSNETHSLMKRVEQGLRLALTKYSMDANSMPVDSQRLNKVVRHLMDGMTDLIYANGFDEFIANATAKRSRMDSAELSATPPPQNKPLYQLASEVAQWVDRDITGDATGRYKSTEGPKLRQIGGSFGSEPINVSPFGKASGNMFTAGVRMAARASLLSHFVSVINRDLMKFGKATFESKGWRIGQDGMPVYVSERGTLTGMGDVLRTFENNPESMAKDIQDTIRYTYDSPSVSPGKVIEKTMGHAVGDENEVKAALYPVVNMIKKNSFLPADGLAGLGTGYGRSTSTFFAGLTADGKSVTIQDVAKAFGAVAVVEDTIGYKSEVLNALYQASERGIPQIIEANKLVQTLKDAGVSDTDIVSSRLREIQNKFNGTDLSVGELIDLVAMMHEVPTITSYTAGNSTRSILSKILSGDQGVENYRQLYNYVNSPEMKDKDSATVQAFRTYLNWALGQDEKRDPMAGMLKGEVKTSAEGGVGAGRFFLMDCIESSVMFSYNANDVLNKLLGKERGKEVAKRIIEKLVAKYPDNNQLPDQWDPTRLSGIMVDRSVRMNVEGKNMDEYNVRQRMAAEAVFNFGSRLESLLVRLTPMAEKLASRMAKDLADDVTLGFRADTSERIINVLSEFYYNAIDEGLRNSFTSSMLSVTGEGLKEAVREFGIYGQGSGGFHGNYTNLHNLGKRLYGYAGDAPSSGQLIMHGLVGGAMRAFKDSSHIFGMQSGMAGSLPVPFSNQANILSAGYRNINFAPDADVAERIIVDAATGPITLQNIGIAGEDGGKAESSLPYTLSRTGQAGEMTLGILANSDQKTMALSSAIVAQRGLMAKAAGLIEFIERYDNTAGIERKVSMIMGQSSIRGGEGVKKAIMDNPEMLSILKGVDLGPQMTKAKALLSLASEIEQGLHNMGLGSIVGEDQGSWRSEAYVDRKNAPNYKPVSQASMVRAYTRDGAFVVTSAVEALGALLTQPEVKVLNALVKRDGSRNDLKTAAEPVRVMARTMSSGINLLAESSTAPTTVIWAPGSPEVEATLKMNRVPRVSTALGGLAKRITSEYFGSQGRVENTEIGWYVFRGAFNGRSIGSFISNGYRSNSFVHRMAHTMDGTSLLLGAAQALNQAGQRDLGLRLESFVGKDWKPVRWPDIGTSIDSRKEYFQNMREHDLRVLTSFLGSVKAAMIATSIPDMARALHDSVDQSIGHASRVNEIKDAVSKLLSNALGGDSYEHHSAVDVVQKGLGEGRKSVLNGLSVDRIKQISVMAGMAFLESEFYDKLGDGFSIEEKASIKGAVSHLISHFDMMDEYDISEFMQKRGGGYGDIGISVSYKDSKNSLSYDAMRDALAAVTDTFSYSGLAEKALPFFGELAKLPGMKNDVGMNSSTNVFITRPTGFPSDGGSIAIGSMATPSDQWVLRKTDQAILPVARETIGLGADIEGNSEDIFGFNLWMRDWGNNARRAGVAYALPINGGGSNNRVAFTPYDNPLGALGAMIDHADPHELIDALPEQQAGVASVNVGTRGHSALSSSVIRSFVADSIVSRAQQVGAPTIEIAPAGIQLSHGSGGLAEITGFNSTDSGFDLKEKAQGMHGRGMRSISLTTHHNIHAKRNKKPLLIQGGESSWPAGEYGSNATYGTGYTGSMHQAGEFAPKKGVAWKRLPDGRIMVNFTGDHLGYKSDYTLLGSRRVGYGFSLAEGVGYDPNSGLLIPGNAFGQIITSDYLEAFNHPLSGIFSNQDPMMMQAYIDAAVRDKRGYHHTRGELPDHFYPLQSGSTMSGRIERADFLSFLVDPSKSFERRAMHASSYIEANAPSSYISMILPGNLTVDDLAAHLVAMQVDPTIGGALNDGSKRPRSVTSKDEFNGKQFSGDRRDRATYSATISKKVGVGLPVEKAGAYGLGTLQGLTQGIQTAISRDPNLWADAYASAMKILGEEGGYFLPDTERTLAMNGDSGLAITHLFPKRPDLLKYSWDAKDKHGIKVWKRTGPKDDPSFRAHVVEMNSPSMIAPEGGLVIGKKAIAFRTEAEAIAYANKVSASMTEASTLRALAGNEYRIVERPNEGGSDKFMPEAKVRAIERVIPMAGMRAFEQILEPTGLHRVGDMDMAMELAEARKLGRAIGKNMHIEFDTPPVSLRQITGTGLPELEALVRQKANFGLPQGMLNFASKAMNAIVRGLPPNNRDFTHITGTDWMNLLKKNGVSKDEMRQTGLAHLLLNAGAMKLSRQDLAEFLAATFPVVQRTQAAFYPMHAAQQLAALNLPGNESVTGIRGTYVPPYVHDSRMQSRSNQLTALKAMNETRLKLSNKLNTSEVEASPSAKEKIATSIAYIDSKLSEFAKIVGVPEELIRSYVEEGREMPEYSAIWDHVVGLMGKEDQPFMTYDTRVLELGRVELNEKIRAFAADAADAIILSDVEEVQPFVRSLLMTDVSQQAKSISLKLHEDAVNDSLGAKQYGYSSDMAASMGQTFMEYGSFPYTSYISAAFEQHHQGVVRFADKVGLAKINEYAGELRKEISRVFALPNDTPEIRKQNSERLALLKQMLDTTERVKSVRVATAAQLSSESRKHGTHFQGSMPGGEGMTGGKGAYEIGHSRSGWGIMTSALGLDGFATLVGIDKNGELPLLQRREPIALLEEVQSDVFQNVDLFGAYSNPDMFLPVDAKDLEGFSKSSELAKLISEHASLMAMADDGVAKAQEMVQSIIGHRSENGEIANLGTRTFDILSARLFLDQTDLFQRSMMHEAVPALMRNTGRKAKVPEGIRASIARMTGGIAAPKEIFVFDFDHELIELLRGYRHLTAGNVPEEIRSFIRERMKENMSNARHADPAMGGDPRMVQMRRKMLADLEGSNLGEVASQQLSMVQSIIKRGVEALRSQGYDALKNEIDAITSIGSKGDHALFLKAMFNIGKRSSNIGDVVAAHVAKMIISDEQLATQLGSYTDGTAAIDYESLVDRSVERIRKHYADSKSYIGKAVLTILDEMKRMPAEARPHNTAVSGFSDVKTYRNSDLVRSYRDAMDNIGVKMNESQLDDVLNSLPDPIEDGRVLYVRAGGFDPSRMMNAGPDSNTFRVIRTKEDFVKYVAALRSMGYTPENDIMIYSAPYHRHAGSAAGDFAKNVVEVYSSLGAGPRFKAMAEAKEVEIAAKRKEVKETFDPNNRGFVNTPRGEKNVYPESVPLVRDGFYKSTQLIMNVLDSMNHGQHGVGIMDATYQLQRGGGLKGPQSWLRIGGGKGYIINMAKLFTMSDTTFMTQGFSGSLLAYEKKMGRSANGPDGVYGGFLHRLRTMVIESELGNEPWNTRFDHAGHTDTLEGHLKLAMLELADSMEGTFYTGYVARFKDAINRSGPLALQRNMVEHSFEGGKVNPTLINNDIVDRVSAKAGEQSTIYAIAGASGESAGWGYISNYGLPMYALELLAPGTSSDFRSPFALDLFDRPKIDMDGNWLVLFDKTGRPVEKLDQTTATPRQLESFRERYLQLSQYKGRNWMVGAFLNEFGPAGGYVDFGVVGPTSTYNGNVIGRFNLSGGESLFPGMVHDDVLARIRAKFIDKGVLPTHLGETTPASAIPGLTNPSYNAGDIDKAVKDQMRERGIIGEDVMLGENQPREAYAYRVQDTGNQYNVNIKPEGRMVQPLTPFATGRDQSHWFHAGLSDMDHVRGLINLYFPRAAADPAAAASYIMRMTNPLTTTLVHTPLKRTKEQDIQFRRRVLEGIPLMQITGANAAKGEPISANGVKKLAHLLKQRDMLPRIKEQDETP